jgi:3-phosphoshikimate 1-carboxyvinyltransferase
MEYKEINTGFTKKVVSCPSSKSYSNRALFLASVLKESKQIQNISNSSDVTNFISCLKSLGLNIKEDNDTVEIKNSFPECEKKEDVELNAGEGGTTARFLVALCARGKNAYTIQAKGRMKDRPMDDLYDALRELGVKVEKLTHKSFPVKIQGPIKKKDISISCKHSTQFASALLMTLVDKDINVEIENLKTSKLYIDITLKVIETLQNENKFVVPVDFSGMANILALGCLNEGVTIANCFSRDELQGDVQILDVIKMLGGEFHFSQSGLTIYSLNEMKGFEWDCKDCLDLVPVLAFLACCSKGVTKLRNVKVLQLKESNRIEEILMILDGFGINAKYDTSLDELEIKGGKLRTVEEFIPYPDHRMVMLAALLMKVSGGGVLQNSQCVNKSYPGFFKDIQ